MINSIINGIAVKLNYAFGSDYRIYKENIEQGFEEPCFSIVLLQSDTSAKLPNRYLRQNSFDIHYFPKSTTDAKNEMYSVAEKLMIELEYITVNHNALDNLSRGSRMRYELVDNVLHFFVNYDFFIKKTMDEVDHMESLESNSKLEG